MNTKMPDQGPFPTHFRFTYGCWEESQQLEWQDGKLVYRPNFWSAGDQVFPVTTTLEDWMEFWAAADSANLWRWQEEYMNPLVLDGLQWSLEISYQGLLINCGGSNAVPGWQDGPEFPENCEFGRFLEAVKALSKGKFQWAPESAEND
jgi:hypothetical protein